MVDWMREQMWEICGMDDESEYCIGCKWEGDCPEVDDDTEIYDCPNKEDK